jgi:hypothetical protein
VVWDITVLFWTSMNSAPEFLISGGVFCGKAFSLFWGPCKWGVSDCLICLSQTVKLLSSTAYSFLLQMQNGDSIELHQSCAVRISLRCFCGVFAASPDSPCCPACSDADVGRDSTPLVQLAPDCRVPICTRAFASGTGRGLRWLSDASCKAVTKSERLQLLITMCILWRDLYVDGHRPPRSRFGCRISPAYEAAVHRHACEILNRTCFACVLQTIFMLGKVHNRSAIQHQETAPAPNTIALRDCGAQKRAGRFSEMPQFRRGNFG